MSMPAARLSSLTAHGGTVTGGSSRVLISGLPAARLGDAHTCPLFNLLLPHTGGIIVLGSATVVSDGLLQARMTDPCICGAPNTIALGDFTVLVGSSPGFDSPLGGAVMATFLTQQSTAGGGTETASPSGAPGGEVE
jgi:uncharacterized Zn-binding protein involved in type VI secretion